jgi:hypothetical protein
MNKNFFVHSANKGRHKQTIDVITMKLIVIIVFAKDELINACTLIVKSMTNFISSVLTTVRIGRQTIVGAAVDVSI